MIRSTIIKRTKPWRKLELTLANTPCLITNDHGSIGLVVSFHKHIDPDGTTVRVMWLVDKSTDVTSAKVEITTIGRLNEQRYRIAPNDVTVFLTNP